MSEPFELKDKEIQKEYVCGECGEDVKIVQKEVVKCKYCGFHIFYKKRIKKPTRYLCR